MNHVQRELLGARSISEPVAGRGGGGDIKKKKLVLKKRGTGFEKGPLANSIDGIILYPGKGVKQPHSPKREC